MNVEIEAKFVDVDHDEIRNNLGRLGATMKQPMRLMRRVVIHNRVMTEKNAFVRIRDEGYRTTITYKQFDDDSVDGAKEYEVRVSSFEDAISIFNEAGLVYDAFQESRRENWVLDGVEIMLDEWPWLNPFIEIEASTEDEVKALAAKLGFRWGDAVFGGAANVYRHQYPHIGSGGNDEINHKWTAIRFDDPMPSLLRIN
jgi:adenylate cyclase class 2